MQSGYEQAAADVLSRLTENGYYEGTIAAHRRCYEGLRLFLSLTGQQFTMEIAISWLETRKQELAYSTYKNYRSALYRLDRYMLNGDISRTMCWSIDDFACRDTALTLPKPLYELYCEIKSVFSDTFCESSSYHYSQGCKDFLRFLAEHDCPDTVKLTIDTIIDYASDFYGSKGRISGEKSSWLSGIVNMLTYIATRGDVPQCYAYVLPRNTGMLKLLPLKIESPGKAFQPSKCLEPLVPGYLSSLDEMKYKVSSKKLFGNDLINFFLFLELNHLEFSDEVIQLWLDKFESRGTFWERRRHTVTLFAEYIKTGRTDKKSLYAWQPLQIDSLPNWSRSVVTGFVGERQREGLAKTTLTMCRNAGYRFFKFLSTKEVYEPSGITPELVKEFHVTDIHSTPESKNAYGIKTRQLLSYMAEQKLVPKNLCLAISTQCAPRRSIVKVMSAEMESAIYDYRSKASAPMELRDTAVVMLGLRMGLRASDIVALQIEDFNWSKRTVSFIQKKTQKEITLPVPVDVGNSVHRYIMEGRPSSGINGIGCVFIRHLAPFGSVTSQICRSALTRILSANGLKLERGQGFHITRKTFASRLLTFKNTIDDISNALGHAAKETAAVYLAHDEDGMRLCPLPFESVVVL